MKRKQTGSGSGDRSPLPVGTAVAAAQAASLPKDDASSPNHSRTGSLRGSEVDHQAARFSYRNSPRYPSSTAREPFSGEGSEKVDAPTESVGQAPTGNRLSNYDSAKFMEHTKKIHDLVPSETSSAVTVLPASNGPSTDQDHVESRMSPELENENQQPHLRQSTSPPRYTRFSSHLSIIGTGEQIHSPPARSVSPVKPALKNHPKDSLSPDGRAAAVGRPGQALSEVSDGTSVASDDGSRLEHRRKPAKVSFDDEAEIVGVAASPPTSPDVALPESPPGKSKFKSGWFGGKKKSSQPESFGDDEFDDVLKPRPALPSFGSIRSTREIERQEHVREELNDGESTASASSNEIVTGLPFSSDHALGGLLKENRSNDAPEPTEFDRHAASPSSDANGQRSASDLKESQSGYGVEEVPSQEDMPSSDKSHERVLTPDPTQESSAKEDSPPAGAVQSASRDVEKQMASAEFIRVPGGFPRTSLELDRKSFGKKEKRKSREKSRSAVTDVHESGKPKSEDNVTEESGESIYSDASEDVDGDGFGSINAIMSGELSKPNGSIDTAVQSSEIDQGTHAVTSEQESVIKQSPGCPYPLGNPSVSTYAPAGTKSTRRPVSVDAYKARQSPEGPNGTLAKQTARDTANPQLKPGQGRSKRPVSMDPGVSRRKDTSDGDILRHSQPAIPLVIPRPGSSGSDSSSSFKRSTGPSSKAGSQHSMKRTLRSSPRVVYATGSSNPSGKRRPQSSGSGPGKMRTTLRTGNKNNKPSFFSTGKASKAKAPKSEVFQSRFSDSDDEDVDDSPRAFRSRFDYSSDDRGSVDNTFRPVRGIPRRQGAHDGDSTELEDSSEDEKRPPSRPPTAQKPNSSTDASPLAAVARSRGTTREELESFLYQPPKNRKSSFLTWLGIRRPKNRDGKLRRFSFGDPGRVNQHPEQPPVERHTRHHSVPNGYGNQDVVSTAPTDNPETPPRLSKRGSKRYTMTDDWLPNFEPRETGSPEPTANPNSSTRSAAYQPRPSLKDSQKGDAISGPGSSTPENDGASRSQVHDDVFDAPERNASAREVVITPAGRKRRFPALRRALGLRS